MRYVIIGGGIAGVTCALEIVRSTTASDSITLVSPGETVKVIENSRKLSKHLEEFDVVEKPLKSLTRQSKKKRRKRRSKAQKESKETKFAGISVLQATVTRIDPSKHLIFLENKEQLSYDRLCIASGAAPQLLSHLDRVIGIRDTWSVEVLGKHLQNAKRVLLVGNGAIALQLVHALRDIKLDSCEIVWVVRHEFLGSTFLDEVSSTFLLSFLFPEDKETKKDINIPETSGSKSTFSKRDKKVSSSALGPTWLCELMSRVNQSKDGKMASLKMEFGAEVKNITEQTIETATNLSVELTNGKTFVCDFLISATGVVPNTQFLGSEFKLGPDGGVLIDQNMQTSCDDVFAAGDVVCCQFNPKDSEFWFQMRLWSQAKIMGYYAAKAMTNQVDEFGFDFSLFAHVTRFFGQKVVCLGRFNCQGLVAEECEILTRVTPNKEFVKLVLYNKRAVGATLIGDTDLEETFENLILNQLDLSAYGDEILSTGVDLGDYFD